MGRIEKSIEIKAPPEKVWEMLALDRFWRTQKNVKSVEYTSEAHTLEDKLGVGASARITDTEGRQYDMEITKSLENKKISSRSTNAPYLSSLIVTYVLKPKGAGTEMTYAVDYELLWGIFGKLLDISFAHRSHEKDVEKALENLKSILEN